MITDFVIGTSDILKLSAQQGGGMNRLFRSSAGTPVSVAQTETLKLKISDD
jgi:hypothetical protein